MKLEKIKLTELADAELNEREMCRILGGGTPGCCQCGCHYATSGGSSTSTNGSANNEHGYTSDPTSAPKESETETSTVAPTYPDGIFCRGEITIQATLCR